MQDERKSDAYLLYLLILWADKFIVSQTLAYHVVIAMQTEWLNIGYICLFLLFIVDFAQLTVLLLLAYFRWFQ